MGDTRFSFQNRGKLFNPAWASPEGKKYTLPRKILIILGLSFFKKWTPPPATTLIPMDSLPKHFSFWVSVFFYFGFAVCLEKIYDEVKIMNEHINDVISLILSASVTLALQKNPEDMNVRASDMWSFAILLWELVTREVPFAGLSPMEIGMKVMRKHSVWKFILKHLHCIQTFEY